MAERAAAVLCLLSAAGALYAICRQLCCSRLPAAFGAAAWTLSEAMLRPGAVSDGAALTVPSVLLPFALAGVFSRERRRWPFLGLAVACLAYRWRSGSGAAAAELEALVLAVLAALGAQRLWDGEGGPAFLIGAAGAIALALFRSDAASSVRWLEAVPVAAALVLVAVASREFRARAGLVALVALFFVQRAVEIGVGAAARRPVVTAGRSGPRAP